MIHILELRETSKIQKKPPTLLREHQAPQNMFFIFGALSVFLDPDPESQHCIYIKSFFNRTAWPLPCRVFSLPVSLVEQSEHEDELLASTK
jgi:hypothetical protein